MAHQAACTHGFVGFAADLRLAGGAGLFLQSPNSADHSGAKFRTHCVQEQSSLDENLREAIRQIDTSKLVVKHHKVLF